MIPITSFLYKDTYNCTNLLMSYFPLVGVKSCRCEEVILSALLYFMAHLLVALLSRSIVLHSDECFFYFMIGIKLTILLHVSWMSLFLSSLRNHFPPPF